MRGRLALSLFLLSMSSARSSLALPASPEEETVPIEIQTGPLGSGKLYVSCRFDGTPVRCLLDSGATFSSVPAQGFEAYPAIGKLGSKGAANQATYHERIEIAQAKLGPLAQSLQVSREGGGGLVGMDLLGERAFSLSFGSRPSLSWPLEPALPLGELRRHKGVFSLPIQLAAQPQRALWDTGAGLSCVERSLLERRPEAFHFLRDLDQGRDSAGLPVKMSLYRVDSLELGGLEFRDVDLIAMDFAVVHEHLASDVSVILGYNVIKQANWEFDPVRLRWKVGVTQAHRAGPAPHRSED